MKYYCEEKEQVLKELSASDDGMRQAEAERRLEQDGKNRQEGGDGQRGARGLLRGTAESEGKAFPGRSGRSPAR